MSFCIKISLFNLFFFMFSQSITSQSGKSILAVADSLEQIVNKTEGKEKLKALSQLAYETRIYKEGLEYVLMFEEEAKKQSNNTMLQYAYYYKSEYHFYVTLLNDSALYYLNKGDALGETTTYKKAKTLRYAIYVKESKFSLAIYDIKKRIESKIIEKDSNEEGMAYVSLGFLYKRLGNNEEAITACEKSLEIFDLLCKNAPRDSLVNYLEYKLYPYPTLIDSYKASKQYKSAIMMADSAFSTLTRIQQTTETIPLDSYSSVRLFTYTQRAAVCIEMGDLIQARKDLNNAQNNLTEQTSYFDKAVYLQAEALYYYNKGEYHMALDFINKAVLNIPPQLMKSQTTIGLRTLKSRILNKLNRSADAYKLLEELTVQKDSLNAQQMSSQVAEIQTIYEVSKIKEDLTIETVRAERSKIIIIGLLSILFLLALVIFIIIRNKKYREKKNKKIYEQYQLMKSYLDKIRAQRDELQLTREEESEESINWAEKAHSYLLETEAFKKEDLSRDDLAIALGTNRQYLIDSIKNETGKTFKDYINSIRVEYAYEILITDRGASIESIYTNSGFTSRSTFNRLFKNQYGMSPLEMREAAKQKEEEIEILAEDNE